MTSIEIQAVEELGRKANKVRHLRFDHWRPLSEMAREEVFAELTYLTYAFGIVTNPKARNLDMRPELKKRRTELEFCFAVNM